MRILPFLLLLSVLLLQSCNKKAQDIQDQAAIIEFELASFEQKSASCATDTLRCATIALSYPVAQGLSEAANAINDSIYWYVRVGAFMADPSTPIPDDLTAIADTFIHNYENFLQESPDYQIGWEIKTTGDVIYNSSKVIAIELSTYSFMGGAHPNANVNLLNFDPKTGKKLTLNDLVTDTGKLAQLVEAKFRQAKGLASDADLGEAGYFWGEGFKLPENFSVTAEGLYFFYNAYEAAAYAEGVTEFVIKNEELNGILKK